MTSASTSGSRWLYVPTGPDSLPVATSSIASASRRRPRSTSNAQPASFSPNVVGSAWTEWVRPIITRAGLGAGPRHEDLEQPVRVAQEQLAGRAQLQRERGVDHVRRRQPEVQEPALRPDRLGDLGHERDDVVVGRPLELLDPRDVDLRPRLDRRERVLRDPAAPRLRPADRELDAEHVLEPGLVGPDRAHLGQRVAADHRAAPTRSPGSAGASPRCRAGAGARPTRSGRRPPRPRLAPAAGPAPRPTTVSTRPPFVP